MKRERSSDSALDRAHRRLISLIIRVAKAFHRNHGFLLAGSVAHYGLLSVIPLAFFLLIILSSVIPEERLLAAIPYYLLLFAPGQVENILEHVVMSLHNRKVLTSVVLVVLFVFSALGFRVLEDAMSVILSHRERQERRHFLVTAILPYVFVVIIGLGLLSLVIIQVVLAAMGHYMTPLLGELWIAQLPKFILYSAVFTSEVVMFTLIYKLMPVGSIPIRYAFAGGLTASVLWEAMRHVMGWYVVHFSFVNVVYGSFATAVVILLMFEIAALILLLGAQVIAEIEHPSGFDPLRMREKLRAIGSRAYRSKADDHNRG